MASNDNFGDKPNLRPTKHVDAGGKTIFLHHNPNHPSNKSYIHAIWNNTSDQSTKDDPFGIEQPHVEYSLNKQQRWEILSSFRGQLADQSSSSTDNELDVQSDSEQQQQQRKKKIQRRRRDLNASQTKYRLYELHNTNRQADCVSITTNTGQQRTQVPRGTYMQGPPSRRQEDNPANNDENRRTRDTTDVTYYAVVPPPKEKQLSNIRKQHNTKSKQSSVLINNALLIK